MILTEILALFQAFNANVGEKERVGSIVSGATLAIGGLRRRSFWGYLSAALGLYLAYRGITGYCAGYNRFGINRCSQE